MSVEFVKGEIYYYKGFVPTVEEVEEIIDFCRQSPMSSLDEVISDYYGC